MNLPPRSQRARERAGRKYEKHLMCLAAEFTKELDEHGSNKKELIKKYNHLWLVYCHKYKRDTWPPVLGAFKKYIQ